MRFAFRRRTSKTQCIVVGVLLELLWSTAWRDAHWQPWTMLVSFAFGSVIIASLFRRDFLKMRQRIRLLYRRCPSCGYDLRATPDRCPECGSLSQKLQ